MASQRSQGENGNEMGASGISTIGQWRAVEEATPTGEEAVSVQERKLSSDKPVWDGLVNRNNAVKDSIACG